MCVHANITKARKAAKLSKAQLAKRCGVTRSAVTQWEYRGGRGTIPSRSNLKKIARATRRRLADIAG
jgi:transcriptional regulator with XRE-family HTH domain